MLFTGREVVIDINCDDIDVEDRESVQFLSIRKPTMIGK